MATPLKPSAADRRRPTRWDGAVVLCVLALAAALFWALLPPSGGGELTAVVTVDGATVAVLPLYPPEAAEESRYYTLDTLAYPLVLEYKTGAIRVEEAHCPGRDCQRIGWIDRAGEQIVCLPNRVVITLTGNNAADFDAVTG